MLYMLMGQLSYKWSYNKYVKAKLSYIMCIILLPWALMIIVLMGIFHLFITAKTYYSGTRDIRYGRPKLRVG